MLNGTSQDSAVPCPPSTLLGMLAQRLTTLGIDIREHERGGELREIAVINPRDPEKGRVVMGCDGYLTWERWCGFRTGHDAYAVAQAIGVLLDDNISQRFEAGHHRPATVQPVHTPEPTQAGNHTATGQQ
jgi:hypothetical protein